LKKYQKICNERKRKYITTWNGVTQICYGLNQKLANEYPEFKLPF
jgi:hypothetical protein